MATRPSTAASRGPARGPLRSLGSAWRHVFGRASPRMLLGVLLLALNLSFAVANVRADSDEERRVRAGARLFRALLAADLGLEHKTEADGALHVLVYRHDPKAAQEAIDLIAPAGDADQARIRGLDVRVEGSDALPSGNQSPPAGVFLASAPTGEELDRLVKWSIAQHVIVYSPFEGHVERGIMAGIAIEAKVQPFVNLTTLEASGVELKPFFLKVAKVHR